MVPKLGRQQLHPTLGTIPSLIADHLRVHRTAVGRHLLPMGLMRNLLMHLGVMLVVFGCRCGVIRHVTVSRAVYRLLHEVRR